MSSTAAAGGGGGGKGGDDVKEEKQALRTTLRARLAEMGDDEIARQSQVVADKVLSLPEYKSARGVACFLSMRKEFNTRPLVEAIIRDGKTLYLPRVESAKERTMSMLKAESIEDLDAWPKSKWGIPEPPKDGPPRLEALDEESDLDMVLVPGLAFDSELRRLGQGAGFYDRWLSRAMELRKLPSSFGGAMEPIKLVGVTLDDLMVPRVPTDKYDMLMDRVVCPSALHTAN